MPIILGMLVAGAAPATVPATPAPATIAASAVPSERDRILSAVHREWPRYDQGGKGRLTPLEFSTWVMRSHGAVVSERAHGGGIAPVSAMNASATAFAHADANHDGGVTPEEMTRFLMTAPASPAIRKAPPPVPQRPPDQAALSIPRSPSLR